MPVAYHSVPQLLAHSSEASAVFAYTATQDSYLSRGLVSLALRSVDIESSTILGWESHFGPTGPIHRTFYA